MTSFNDINYQKQKVVFFFSFKFVLVLEVCVHNMKRWIIRTFNITIHL